MRFNKEKSFKRKLYKSNCQYDRILIITHSVVDWSVTNEKDYKWHL